MDRKRNNTKNGHIRFMDMTQVSKSSIIYGSVYEFVEVHKSLSWLTWSEETLHKLEKALKSRIFVTWMLIFQAKEQKNFDLTWPSKEGHLLIYISPICNKCWLQWLGPHVL